MHTEPSVAGTVKEVRPLADKTNLGSSSTARIHIKAERTERVLVQESDLQDLYDKLGDISPLGLDAGEELEGTPCGTSTPLHSGPYSRNPVEATKSSVNEFGMPNIQQGQVITTLMGDEEPSRKRKHSGLFVMEENSSEQREQRGLKDLKTAMYDIDDDDDLTATWGTGWSDSTEDPQT